MELSSNYRLKYQKLVSDRSVKHESGCWVWLGAKTSDGYGCLKSADLGKNNTMAHRLSYAAFKENPEGMVVRHTCDNPKCVNPEHLLLGTNTDNMRDKVMRGRASKGGVKPKVINPRVLRMLRDLGYSQSRIGRMFGLCDSVICRRLKTLESQLNNIGRFGL